MESTGEQNDDLVAVGKERMSNVDDERATFKSHLDGPCIVSPPEVSMWFQHELGADIMFAFHQLTTPVNTRGYQVEFASPTWRSGPASSRSTSASSPRCPHHWPYQALFGVLQGAQYEDLRCKAARGSRWINLHGFGIGEPGEGEPRHHHPLVQAVCREQAPSSWHLQSITVLQAIKTGVTPSISCLASRAGRNAAISHTPPTAAITFILLIL